MYLNSFAPTAEPLDMTHTEEFRSLLASATEIGGALVGDADAPLLRAAFEQRPAAGELRDGIGDMVGFAKRKARKQIDARIARAVSAMAQARLGSR